MSHSHTLNGLDAAAELGVSYNTLLRWVRIGGSEQIDGAVRVGKEWAIPASEVDRIKARRQRTESRIQETRDWAYSIERLHRALGADAFAGLHTAAQDFLQTSDSAPLVAAVEEFKACRAMQGLVDAAREQARRSGVEQ